MGQVNNPPLSLPLPKLSHDWYEDKGQKLNNDQEHQEKTKNSSSRPFLKASETWYAKNSIENLTNQREDLKKRASSLPYERTSNKWYKNRGKLYGKNQSRSQKTQQTKIGTKPLEESIAELEAKLIEEDMSDVISKDCTAVLEVGKYLLVNGPLVAAKELGEVYRESRKSSGKRRLRPSELIRKLVKYFNISQITVHGMVYILENKYPNIQKLVKSLNDNVELNKKKCVNDQVRSSIGHLFSNALAFTDTKKDRDIIKALFTKATTVRFVADLMNRKNKSSIMACRDELEENLNNLDKLWKTSKIVRNDMTCEQQHRLTARIINKRKQNMLRLAYEPRGRKLKSDIFPQLGIVLENIFQGGEVGDGGLECHPRLTTNVQYRSKDRNFL